MKTPRRLMYVWPLHSAPTLANSLTAQATVPKQEVRTLDFEEVQSALKQNGYDVVLIKRETR